MFLVVCQNPAVVYNRKNRMIYVFAKSIVQSEIQTA